MKKLLIILPILVLVGAGCFDKPDTPDEKEIPTFEGVTYENREFGFAFDYPDFVDLNIRKDSNRPHNYAGMEVDFFLSIRDAISEAKPNNLAYVYAVPTLDRGTFRNALVDNFGIEITSEETVEINDLTMTKFVNTTDHGDPKIHYLFDRHDKTIILSVFIGKEVTEPFEPIIYTFKKFE